VPVTGCSWWWMGPGYGAVRRHSCGRPGGAGLFQGARGGGEAPGRALQGPAGPKTGALIGGIAKLCGGGGGGRPNLAQAGGRDGAALDRALAQAGQQLLKALG